MLIRAVCRCLLTTALFCASVYGQDHNAAVPSSPGGDPVVVALGQAQFKSSCGFCHGEDATGSRAPDLVRSSILAHDEEGSLLAPTIRNGRSDKGMPAFPALTDKQIAGIVAFLHHQAYEALNSGNVPGNYPVAKLMTGNAAAGKSFFLGDGGCTGCHSVDGDLKGVSTRLTPIDLQQAIVYPEEGPRVPKVTAEIKTKEGARYEGNLVEQDEFRISIVGKDGWYRSFAVPDVSITIHDPLEAHRALTSRYTDADIHNLFAFLETLK